MANGKKIAMGIGIALVLALFAGFGAQYIGNYFGENCGTGSCIGNYIYSMPEKAVTDFKTPESKCENITKPEICKTEADCYWTSDYSQDCQQQRQNAFSVFAAIIGISALAFGFIVQNNNTVSGGTIGGGIISLVIAIVGVWSQINELFRVVLIGLIVAALIFIAYKKLKD